MNHVPVAESGASISTITEESAEWIASEKNWIWDGVMAPLSLFNEYSL